jgi:ABC-type nitrate/sulfonate/bicarbonate transport system permease component
MQGGGSNGILHHLLYSFQRTLLGSGIGVVLGVMCGLLMAFERRARLFLEAPIETMRMIPPLAAIPFFLMWFGPTETAQLTMVAFYCFFMMIINTVSAVANTSPIYTDYARTLGASKVRVYWTVILPAIVPELIGGIRVVIGVSWGIQIVTELMGAQGNGSGLFDGDPNASSGFDHCQYPLDNPLGRGNRSSIRYSGSRLHALDAETLRK